MSEITIVTAFFDIGRGQFGVWSRSDEKYFEYFKFWARIKNKMIVYCQPENRERVYQIRHLYGLEGQTIIKTIDDVYSIEPDIFSRMCKIENNEEFRNSRYYNHAMSNKASYDYIMLLKYWCLKDAAAEEESDRLLAWVDFGYNHGDARYIKSEDFDFLWKYDFPNKVTAFCLNNPDEMTGIDSLQFQKDCFIGHTLVMPQSMCEKYWQYIKTAMNALISLDCIDDDQQLQLMVYKMHKEDFNIIICDWFEDFMICSNQKFTTRETEVVKSVRKLSFTRKIKSVVRYVLHGKPKTPLDDFIKRIEEKGKKYYS